MTDQLSTITLCAKRMGRLLPRGWEGFYQGFYQEDGKAFTKRMGRLLPRGWEGFYNKFYESVCVHVCVCVGGGGGGGGYMAKHT